MSIQLFDTLTGKKKQIVPIQSQQIKMYCCGVTPYSNTHIGHSRTFFSYDLLFRTLKDNNYNINWARNITDVDDKIIKKSLDENTTCEEVVSRYVAEQDEMLNSFDLNRPLHEPKVTENIPQIIELIQKLVDKNYAYKSTSGVYYRVRKFSSYGKLSKNKIDDLKTGARIEVDESKEDALDFALWKFAKPGEIFWSSPWGDGRPGWHVECSAMIHTLFGDFLDIHMGGRDLIFPHHEAEIAQSEAATGQPLANIWMHAGMVTLYGDKMSKSTNHFVSIKDFLSKYPAEVLRLVFLSVSYSQPLDFTFELVDENLKKLCKLYRFVSLVDSYCGSSTSLENKSEFAQNIFVDFEHLIVKMRESLHDDLNSVAAMALFFNVIKNINTNLNQLEKLNQKLNKHDVELLNHYWPQFKAWIKTTLGILVAQPEEFFESLRHYNLGSEISISQINCKILERKLARDNKDWSKSDFIRNELLAQGIQIQDAPSGTKWFPII